MENNHTPHHRITTVAGPDTPPAVSKETPAMKLNELQTFLEEELTYPVDQESVLAEIGSTELEAPDADETEMVSEIIGDVGQETYKSAEELFSTIIGNVGDEYIGRKFYDDRGGNSPSDSEPKDEADMSI